MKNIKICGIVAFASLVMLTHVVGAAVLIGENDRTPQNIARNMAAPLDTVLK